MFKLAAFATLYVTLVSALAVQGATLQARNCATPDLTAPVCQTSAASPTVGDCAAAISKLSGQCYQGNNVGSKCTSLVTSGTCKIDVCGYSGAQLSDGVNCGGYLQTILNDCQSNGLVGGYLEPRACNVYAAEQPYRLQFSHS